MSPEVVSERRSPERYGIFRAASEVSKISILEVDGIKSAFGYLIHQTPSEAIFDKHNVLKKFGLPYKDVDLALIGTLISYGWRVRMATNGFEIGPDAMEQKVHKVYSSKNLLSWQLCYKQKPRVQDEVAYDIASDPASLEIITKNGLYSIGDRWLDLIFFNGVVKRIINYSCSDIQAVFIKLPKPFYEDWPGSRIIG